MVFRRGMWLVADDKAGIGMDFYDNIATIHFIGEDGNTTLVKDYPYTEVRQATYDEIPEVRRPSKDIAEQYGYL